MITLSAYAARRAIRDQIDRCDAAIYAFDRQIRDQLGDQVPSMSPTAETLAATATAAITVNAEWLAWMLTYLHGGRTSARSVSRDPTRPLPAGTGRRGSCPQRSMWVQ